MNEDRENLRRFRECGDHEAFAEVVRRYIDLVWAVGYRITGDADLARDVAQTVFSDLARKAGQLSDATILAGWLHRAASFAAHRAVRDESRRRTRERQAMEMQSIQPNPEAEESVQRMLPLLDEAISDLQQADREAVLLRFFGKKSLAEIGAAFGISEDAAQKRLARALDRLRSHFRRRGIETSAAFVAAALGTAAAQAAPAGIAVAVAAGSVSAGAAASASLLGNLLAHVPSSIALIKTPIISTTLVLAAVSTPLIYQEIQRSRLAAEHAALKAQVNELPRWREAHAQHEALQRLAGELQQLREGRDELAKLRSEAAALKTADLDQKLEWQRRHDAAKAALAAAQTSTGEIEAKIEAQELSLKRVNDLKRLGLAARIWATDNADQLPTKFENMTNEIGGDVDFGSFVEPFEFVQHPRPISETEPQLILFREKQPRQLPNGKWARAYTLVDGSVQEPIMDTADFSEWERPLMAKPLDAQKAASIK